MKALLIWLLTLPPLLAMSSCQRGEELPKQLDRAKFVRVYADLLGTGQKSGTAVPDTVRTPEMMEVLKEHEVTEAQFRSTVESYRRNVEQWKTFFEEVLKVLEEDRQSKEDSLKASEAQQ